MCGRVRDAGGGHTQTHSVSAVTVFRFRCSVRIKNALLRLVACVARIFLTSPCSRSMVLGLRGTAASPINSVGRLIRQQSTGSTCSHLQKQGEIFYFIICFKPNKDVCCAESRLREVRKTCSGSSWGVGTC